MEGSTFVAKEKEKEYQNEMKRNLSRQESTLLDGMLIKREKQI